MNRHDASPDAANEVLAWAARHAGLHFPETRSAELRRTVGRAIAATRTATPAAYLRQLETDPATRDALITALTVGETFFFRDAGQLEVIRSRILPELMARRPGGVRAWSAGCATGEEAYTLAILLLELDALGATNVLGTDVSWHRLQRARAGTYRTWSLRGLEADGLARYFHSSGGQYQLNEEVRERVRFRRHNLLEPGGDWPAGLDLIVCRNVLIYMDRLSIARIVEGLLGALAPGGWLVLGAADPPLNAGADYQTVMTEAGLAYRHRPWSATVLQAAAETAPAERAHEPPVRQHVSAARSESPTDADVEAELDASLTHVRDLADRGLLRGAIAACDAALTRWGPRADLLSTKAFLLVAAGDAAAGADAARGALYLDPQRIIAHMALAEAHAVTGASAAAARAFRNAERLLADLPVDASVAGVRDESAGSLAALARLRQRQLTEVRE